MGHDTVLPAATADGVRAPGPSGRSFAFATLSAGSAGLLLLLQVVATHVLSVDEFGKFSVALKLAVVAEALMDFGLHQVTIRAIARDRLQAAVLLHNTLAIKLISGSLVLLGMALVVLWTHPETDVRVVCIVMIASAALRSYLLTVRGVFLGLERFEVDAALVVGDRLLLLAAGAGALWWGGGLYGLAAAFFVARLVTVTGALAAAGRAVGRLALRMDVPRWRALHEQAWSIGLFLLLLNLYSYADTIMLGTLSTFQETALYSAAFMMYEGLAYVPAVMSSVLSPRLSALWLNDRDGHRRLARRGLIGAMVCGVVLVIPLSVVAAPLLDLLFGTQNDVAYAEAATALRLLLAGLPFIFGLWILHAVAISTFRERLLIVATATGVTLNVLLNVVMIPGWGRHGAALATLISEGVSLILLCVGLRRVLWGGTASAAQAGAADPSETSREAFGNLSSNLDFLDRFGAIPLDAPVLEIGSGRGFLLATLRQRGLRIAGMDLNPTLLADARARHGALPVVQADGMALPFDSQSFKAVLSFDVFEHVPDPDAHLREVHRVLSADGVYLLQTPNKVTNTVFETIRWRSFTRWRADHCSLHTFGQLKRRLERHGFDVEFADVPLVTPFFRAKVRQHLGPVGEALIAIVKPDRWPLPWRTNFYVRASKRPPGVGR